MVDTQRALPLLATRDLVLFPGMLAPLFVERDKGVRALEQTQQTGGLLVMAAQRSAVTEDPEPGDIYAVGTLAKVVQFSRLSDGTLKALIEGRERVSIDGYESVSPLFTVRYTPVVGKPSGRPRLRTLMDSVTREFGNYVGQTPQLPEEAETALEVVRDPETMVNVVASNLMIGPERKQELLEGDEPEKRLLLLLETLIQENEFIALENEISEKVHDSFERQQRRVFLHERLKVLQAELGEEGEEDSERGAYLKQMEEKKLPEAAAAALTKEIKRLSDLPPLSAEVAVAKTYLDTALGLPWGTRSGSAILDVAAVARVLDETHYGLKSVKDRIIEYLAVASLRGGTPPNAILCLVGPPGVGKTSVAMATAKGLERPLQRISLGGIRDEGEIRGHRRTYVGAMPGRIIDALKRAGVDDPVVVLDEIDKMEADWRGDPAAALMEVLDPVQNRTFRDNYLELEYDLSHVFFIATANYEEDIPETLHDRLEIIRLPGYTDREKMEIAQRHLVPRIAEESGLAELGNVLTPAALRLLIREHTREAGVREMARLIGKVYRRLARMKVEGKALPRRVGPRGLPSLVGPAPFLSARLAGEPQIGVSLGLAYTGAGGDVLRIECVVTPGKGDFHLTGQLGEIMQESVTAAWGYLKTSLVRDPVLSDLWADSPGRAYLLDNYQQTDTGDDSGPVRSATDARHSTDARTPAGRVLDRGVQEPGFRPEAAAGETEPPQPSDHELLSALEVRMHFPEGGVPKEGPSAGIAVATALLSALMQVPVLPKVALTGEITLTGQILPVGGLKEKLLAALREGVHTVVLPSTVAPEVEELQAELKKGLDIVYVDNFIDVLSPAFGALEAPGPGEQEGTEL
ncbi:MAG: LON peptidase substrate-binding domain-containing protein [Thermoleophilia bacterium]|nr:LON peptidase substrate-binding domain-containing protein [Thermoleophilia bacterium]